jgi:hypothetical protein
MTATYWANPLEICSTNVALEISDIHSMHLLSREPLYLLLTKISFSQLRLINSTIGKKTDMQLLTSSMPLQLATTIFPDSMSVTKQYVLNIPCSII